MGFLAAIFFCGFKFGWVWIWDFCLVFNGGFSGLVWCFNGVSQVMVVVVLLLLFGWFGVSG